MYIYLHLHTICRPDLRSHVPDSADQRLAVIECETLRGSPRHRREPPRHELRRPEVRNLQHAARRQEHVGALNIAMNDGAVMQMRKTWGICTRRTGKLHRARSRLYRSKQANFFNQLLVGKLLPRVGKSCRVTFQELPRVLLVQVGRKRAEVLDLLLEIGW